MKRQDGIIRNTPVLFCLPFLDLNSSCSALERALFHEEGLLEDEKGAPSLMPLLLVVEAEDIVLQDMI